MTVEELLSQYIEQRERESAPVGMDDESGLSSPVDDRSHSVRSDEVYRSNPDDERGTIARVIRTTLTGSDQPIAPADFVAFLEQLQSGSATLPAFRVPLSHNDTLLKDTARDLLEQWRRVS